MNVRSAGKTLTLPWLGTAFGAPCGAPRVYWGPPSSALGGPNAKRQKLARAFSNYWWRPNLLYLTSGRPYSLDFIRWARSHGVKTVLNQDGVFFPAWYGPGYEAPNEHLCRLHDLADYVIYQSRFCLDTVKRFVRPPERPYEILYNAVRTDVFVPSTLERPKAHPVILSAGYFYRQKHYILRALLESMVHLRKRMPGVRLLIAGKIEEAPDGNHEPENLMKQAVSFGVGDCIEWLGPYAASEGPALMQRAHVFVHLKNNDPCPSVVLEAMACGLPVVYSTTGGTPELVGGAGISIAHEAPFDRPDQAPEAERIGKAIEQCWNDRLSLSALARQRAVDQFGWPSWVERHRIIFDQVRA